jgi:hypothetical protein
MKQPKPMTVYMAGNPMVKEDNMPFRIMSVLQERFPQIEFKELEPTENLPDEKTLNIIDTVLGIEQVELITNVDKIVTGKVYSMHDFDLGFNLKLMKKLGKVKTVRVIGIPPEISEKDALEGVTKILKEINT